MPAKREIDAVYEGNVFRPVVRVEGLPEHARLRLIVVPPPAKPLPPEDAEARIVELEQLAQAALGNLTPGEEASLAAARLDQRRFFGRRNT